MVKKMKKLLSVVLALSMVMSMATMGAMAAEAEEEATPSTHCGKEEHTHGERCYTEGERVLTCEEAHHTEDCYTAGTPVLSCEEEAHHTDECYTDGELTCEEAHHTEACYTDGGPVLNCTEQHPHSDECYTTEQVLGCELEEHIHSNKCHIQWDEESKTLTITGAETELVAADVSAYKAKAEKVVITDVDSIAKEAFAEFKMQTLEIKKVRHIDYSFRSCTKLETLTIDGVDTIGENAFYNPAALESATISNVGTIGKNAFHPLGVTSLTTLTLSNIETVGNEAFSGSKNLKELSLEKVNTIEFQAFMNCTSLTGKLSLSKDNVKALGASAFLGCTGLTGLELSGVEIGQTAFYGCTGLTEVSVKGADIGPQAFTGCTGLETVTLENVGTIGAQAFSNYGKATTACTALESVTMKNVGTIGQKAFYDCTGLKNATLENIDTVGQYAFQSCTALETVTMAEVERIDNFAFWYCSGLKTVNSLSNVKESIGGFAFYGCESLEGLTVDDLTKMGYIGSYDEIMDRIQAILAGQFELGSAANIEELTLDEGWTAGAIDQSANWNTYENGTQLMEQARWADADNGEAEIKVDAYYTGKQQMDYIFVADLSASMAQLGNPDDQNARFYDMQSKLLNMTSQLLTADGYDCRVAIVTFGGMHATETCNTMPFSSNVDEVTNYIKGLEPLNENTDYGMGMKAALDVVNGQEDGRNTVVVFLSDGYPTVNNYQDGHGTISAGKIKAAGVPIYGVLHSPWLRSTTQRWIL